MFTENRLIYKEGKEYDRLQGVGPFWRNVPKDHDSCGIGFVSTKEGTRSAVDLALTGLCGMKDRTGEAFKAGDGAGVIFETGSSRDFWAKQYAEAHPGNGMNIEGHDQLSVGMFFFEPELGEDPKSQKKRIESIMKQQGVHVHGWRKVPLNDSVLPGHVNATRPSVWQLMYSPKPGMLKHHYDQQLFYAQQRVEREMRGVYPVSLNAATVTYKAKATPGQFRHLYTDLNDPMLVSRNIGFHARMGTNTEVTWPNTQPGRKLFHNGELVSDAAQSSAQADLERRLGITGEGEDCVTVSHGRSDTMHLDGMVQVLMAHGVQSHQALLRRMARATDDKWRYSDKVNALNDDIWRTQGPLGSGQGPAAIVSVTGKRISIAMDNMGLRTFWIYGNDKVVVGSSEVGAPAVNLSELKFAHRLQGGDIAYVDKGHLVLPEVAIERIAQQTRLKVTGDKRFFFLDQKPHELISEGAEKPSAELLIKLWNQIGGDQYAMEVIKSMVVDSKEPIKGMGDDRPLPILSLARLRVAEYFAQMGGVVTNPPVDPLREGDAMDTRVTLGKDPKQLDQYDPDNYESYAEFIAESSLLNPAQFKELIEGNKLENGDKPKHVVIDTTFDGASGSDMQKRLDEIIAGVVEIADEEGAPPIIVLSDKACGNSERLFVPPVFLVSGIHQALRAKGLRDNVKLVFDTMDVVETHDMALLVAQGADAVYPRLLWEMVSSDAVKFKNDKKEDVPVEQRMENLQKAMIEQFKVVMSKYGVVTNGAYKGSCYFEILGLSHEIAQKYFPYNASRIGGLDFDDLVEDQIERLKEKARFRSVKEASSRKGQVMKWMNQILLQEDVKTPDEAYEKLVEYIDNERDPIFLRDLLDFVWGSEREDGCELPLGEVESVASIICRHFRGAQMSDGALNGVAHAAIAVAINELAEELMPQIYDPSHKMCNGELPLGFAPKDFDKGYSKRLDPRPKSGSGEGGEDASRHPGAEFAEACSMSKQIASGRFGVDAYYIMSVGDDGEMQIKIGQGAKPYEGGHVKGHKIDKRLAKQRGTREGNDLISPPTQHDIYSIEDLMRLIWDIRAVHPQIKTVSVKVTTKAGIGTIGVGVAKAGADKVTASGREGGTGAAKSSATRHTGSPLELGILEMFASLKKVGMVDKMRIEVDGGIITGADVVKLAIMGADEFGFGTSLLQAGEGCIFCNACADGTEETGCPVGICIPPEDGGARLGFGAKAVKYLKKGDPMKFDDQLTKCKNATKHYWTLVAKDVQKILAKLGVRSLEELRGRYDLLRRVKKGNRTDKIDLDFIWDDLMKAGPGPDFGDLPIAPKNPVNEVNQKMIDAAMAYDGSGPFEMEIELPGVAEEGTWDPESTLRTIGGTLAGLIAKKAVKIPEGGFNFKLKGYPGQSLGFCMVDGMNLELTGIGRDFIGSAMSGGKIVIKPPKHLQSEESMDLAGASCAYGARGGKLFIAGTAGQRFGVRSCLGTTLVCEGVGKYGFEYMSGGTGVVLGDVGGQLGSGMYDGELFVWNEKGNLANRLHKKSCKIENMSVEDELKLKTIIEEFYADTQSPKAKMILDDWENKKASFSKVVSKSVPAARVVSEEAAARFKQMGAFKMFNGTKPQK